MRAPQIRLVLLLISTLLLLTLALNVAACQQERDAKVRVGATGLRVTGAQWLLNSHDIDVRVTGTFARQTGAAVRGFQAREGLATTGSIDRRTFEHLAPTTRRGDRGHQVRAVQTLLHLQGHQVGVADDFDTATEQAVQAFQRAQGLDDTGVVDTPTWVALFDGPNDGTPVTEADQFLTTIAPYAIEAWDRFGVPASVTMAQSAQETGWGRYAPGNNYFGIKCHNQRSGPVDFDCQELTTGEWENGDRIEISDRFRTYESMADSVADYGNFLRTNSRYAPAFAVNSDADEFARALQEAGYATDPAYADSLIAIMRQRDLYQHNQ